MPNPETPAKAGPTWVAPARPTAGLFAKPPIPGEVKTRLIPPLLPEEAAALYEAFLEDTATLLAGDDRWDWTVYSTNPQLQARTWPASAPVPRRFRGQIGEDLGSRMEAAMAELCGEGIGPALLVGSDHPTLPRGRIEDAWAGLREADVVLGPTTDGGYYLVGVAAPVPGLFAGIPWSTPQVLERTVERIRESGLRLTLLPPWYDVDEVRDLRFLRAHLAAYRLSFPETRLGIRTWEALSRFPASTFSGL